MKTLMLKIIHTIISIFSLVSLFLFIVIPLPINSFFQVAAPSHLNHHEHNQDSSTSSNENSHGHRHKHSEQDEEHEHKHFNAPTLTAVAFSPSLKLNFILIEFQNTLLADYKDLSSNHYILDLLKPPIFS